jgi:hypothetical protein
MQDWRLHMGHIASHKEDSYACWRHLLEGSKMTKVPVSTMKDGLPTVLTQDISMPSVPAGITQASLFTLTCAEALRKIIGESDVVLGRLVSGRIGLNVEFQTPLIRASIAFLCA